MKLVTLYWDSAPILFHQELLEREGKVCKSDLVKLCPLDCLILFSWVMIESFADLDVAWRNRIQVMFESCLN